MAAVSPERAAYEAGRWPDVMPWEEASPEIKDDYRAIAQAAINASPELAEARAAAGKLCGQIAAAERIARDYLGESPEAAGPGLVVASPPQILAARVLVALGVTAARPDHCEHRRPGSRG
jgi:hypothetical protein